MALQLDTRLRGLRPRVTLKRLAILASGSIYLTPEEVWKRVRKKILRAGLPVVYRNLEELSECVVLIKIVHPDRRLYCYFCPNGHHHHHFVCISYSRVEDLNFCGLDVIDWDVRRSLKGTVVSHLMQVYGHCKECLAG